MLNGFNSFPHQQDPERTVSPRLFSRLHSHTPFCSLWHMPCLLLHQQHLGENEQRKRSDGGCLCQPARWLSGQRLFSESCFEPQNLQDGREESDAESCTLTSTRALPHPINKHNKSFFVEAGDGSAVKRLSEPSSPSAHSEFLVNPCLLTGLN